MSLRAARSGRPREDWAAGALIAREAGATVTPLQAEPDTAGLLAAGPALHGELSWLLNHR